MRQSLLVLTLALTLLSCGGAPVRHPEADVIVISIDTLRSDRVGAYGGDVPTPHMDDLAARGVLFERAYSPYPLTLPAHATAFTGLMPPAHGVRENGAALTPDLPTLAGLFQDAGFRTGGFVSAMVLREATGIARGFEHYDDEMPGSGVTATRSGADTIRQAGEWLVQQPPDESVFLFLHLYEPHTPYEAPPRFAAEHDPYDAEVAHVDQLLGNFLRLLEDQGRAENAVIVLIGDHGEGLGEHGEPTHGILVYREALQVPFILRLPGDALAGRRVAAPAGLHDLLPTLAHIAGLTPLENVDGIALLEKEPPAERPIYGESHIPSLSYGWSPLRSVIQRDFHYIEAPRPELYHLENDPGERENLLPEREPPSTMTAFLDAVDEGVFNQADLSDDETALLESLGYTGTIARAADAPALDPKDQIHHLAELELAREALANRQYQLAEQRALALLDENPRFAHARQVLFDVYEATKSWEKLAQVQEASVELGQGGAVRLAELTLTWLRMGETERALETARAVHEADRGRAADLLSHYLYEEGLPKEALELARKTLARGGESSRSCLILGRHEASRGDCEAATPYLSAAANQLSWVREEELKGAALFTLAGCLAGLNRFDEAANALQRLLEARPLHLQSRAALAEMYVKQGAPERAIATMDELVRDYPTRVHYEFASRVMEGLGLNEAAAFYASEAQRR